MQFSLIVRKISAFGWVAKCSRSLRPAVSSINNNSGIHKAVRIRRPLDIGRLESFGKTVN